MSMTRWQRYRSARDGLLPAEALDTEQREHLVHELVTAGWTDRAIAQHTQQTLYTAGRIRDRIGLAPNREEVAT